jgi:hypothetical protein
LPGVNHLEFIQLAVVRAGNKQLPDAGLFAQAHRVAAAIPVVELPDHGHARAFGAQTEKRVPVTPSMVSACAPSVS